MALSVLLADSPLWLLVVRRGLLTPIGSTYRWCDGLLVIQVAPLINSPRRLAHRLVSSLTAEAVVRPACRPRRRLPSCCCGAFATPTKSIMAEQMSGVEPTALLITIDSDVASGYAASAAGAAGATSSGLSSATEDDARVCG